MAILKLNGLNAQKLSIKKLKSEKELQTIFERNLETIFGIKFLATEFTTTHKGRIDTLGVDENNAPVIIEYKEDEKDNVINQGLFYLDWLLDHKGDFEILAQNKIGKDVKINWDEPRLILVAQSFNEYDKYAVNRISENIELWKYSFYENDVLVVERINLPKQEKNRENTKKNLVTFKEYDENHHLEGKDKLIKDLFFHLKEEIIRIDEKIQEKVKKHYIAFALDKNFCEIVIQANALKIYLDLKKNELKDPENKTQDCSEKGHWATGNTVLKVDKEDQIHYLVTLIKQSYESKL